jgi:hypothetical protein
MATPAAAQLQCPLCGQRFSRDQASCHDGCPLHQHCRVICCPNCGYTLTDTAEMEEGIRRFWKKATSWLHPQGISRGGHGKGSA